VLNSVTKKVGNSHIKSAYVKLTMSKPIKIA
jgi:ribosomal protein L1